MPTPPITLSPHAIDRLEERWGCTAFGLEVLLPRARYVEPSQEGEHIWKIEATWEHPMLLVVDIAGVVKTVLPIGAKPTNRRPSRKKS